MCNGRRDHDHVRAFPLAYDGPVWLVLGLVLLAGCSFEIRAGTPGDASIPDGLDAIDAPVFTCQTQPPWWDLTWQHRVLVDTGGAPPGYTLVFDASAVIAASQASGADVRAVIHDSAGARELDRLVEGNTVALRVPDGGALYLYVGRPGASAGPSAPGNVYAFAEDFEAFAVGVDGAPRFAPTPPTGWSVADAGGNHVYRAAQGSRFATAISDLRLPHGEVEARVRFGTGGGSNHAGLLGRGSNLVQVMFDGFVEQLLGDSNLSRVAEYVDGISPPVQLASLARTVERDRWYRLRLRFAGDTVELYVDGTLEASGPSLATNGDRVGLFAHQADLDYDDVRARAVLVPEPVVALGTLETCE